VRQEIGEFFGRREVRGQGGNLGSAVHGRVPLKAGLEAGGWLILEAASPSLTAEVASVTIHARNTRG
jgi:hypothetical protein